MHSALRVDDEVSDLGLGRAQAVAVTCRMRRKWTHSIFKWIQCY